jgi:hypothetical protein
MRVMMVVMVASQHESFNLRDLARLVNSKESIGLIGFGNSSSVPILDFVRRAPMLRICNPAMPAKMSSPHN